MAVGEWFSEFCVKLRLSLDRRSELGLRTGRITRAVNRAFRNLDSNTAYRFYVGSMGRNTAIASTSDVDLLLELPGALYAQYDRHVGNGQSALLSAVRTAIRTTYSTSDVFGDGQVVVIDFDDGVRFEVLPAFVNVDGGYTFADTNSGGRWRACKPKQEMLAFSQRNGSSNRNLIELCRMVRAWRDFNSVPMSGMLIDTLAFQFMDDWAHRDKSYLYYDFLTRDFFRFLASQNPQQAHWTAPGSGSYVFRMGGFEYKARQAELRALEAIQNQNAGYEWAAKNKYREIYGYAFPS